MTVQTEDSLFLSLVPKQKQKQKHLGQRGPPLVCEQVSLGLGICLQKRGQDKNDQRNQNGGTFVNCLCFHLHFPSVCSGSSSPLQ